jgi:WD40 repeat protein
MREVVRVAMVYSFRWIFSFFLCLFYISFSLAKPVVPGQSQWCVTKQIASSTDVIESKVELLNLDISATSAVLFSEIALLNNDINALESRADVVESLANLLDVCQATPFTASTTISLSGFYCLSATNTVGIITVQAATNNVVVDLNGHRVQGVVVNANNQITFRNGTIDGSNQTGVGLDVLSGATNITLQYLDVQNAQIGIRMTGVSGAIVENCSMSLNFTGMQLNQSSDILIDKSVATANQYAGFDLVSSLTCTLLNSKAVSTGQGNSIVTNNIVAGFSSLNGTGNIFERCIANSTQALSTTDPNSIVAGFVLRGTEAGSKIIGCESANATTNLTGVTIPYGILLQAQVSGLTSVTSFSQANGFAALAWSPDGKYLAVGIEQTTNYFTIYQVDYLRGSFTQIAQATIGGSSTHVQTIAWSPTNYLAIGTIPQGGTDNVLLLYSFDPDNLSLTRITVPIVAGGTTGITSVAWSPDVQYLVVGGQLSGANILYLYSFNQIAQTLTLVQPQNPAQTPNSVAWSADGLYVATADSGATIYLYSFSPATQTLTQVDSHSFGGGGQLLDVAWSPNGKYVAVVGTNNSDLIIFQLNNNTQTLQQMILQAIGIQLTSVAWSPDGNYIMTGGGSSVGNSLRMFRFDPGAPALTLLASTNPDTSYDDINSIAWSPDGQWVAIAGAIYGPTNHNIFIVNALTFPHANLINNNVVYCNSGGSVPFGIGISGSSIANMIIQNTAYSNPLSPFMVDTSYAFVPNVFNQRFGQGPTLLQNIAIGDRQVIQQPVDLALLARQIYSTLITVTGAVTTVSCSPTTITNSNVVGGTISLTQSGNYCLGSAVTGDIAITGTSVALNLNGNCVGGDIIISGDDAYVYNGNVIPVAVATTGSINAGIDILALTNRALISNVVVDASTQPTAANTGRPALRTAGIDTQVYNCTLTAGPALNATGSANGTNGGSGIVLTGSATRTIIQNCTIAGNNGGNGGTTTPFGNGGNGGHGIQVQAGSVSLAEITNCLIVATGAGGAAGSTNGSVTGGRGGDGVNIDASASGIAVHNCIIRNAGAAGLSAASTLVTFIDMMGTAPNISVIDNAAGRAVNDFVTATPNLSVIFANFADTITNPIVYNLNNRQAAPSTDPTNGDGGVLVPNPPDATAGGGNVIVNHIVNVFMSVLSS